MFEFKGQKIWVAGHQGLVGSALVRALEGQELLLQTYAELDLCDQKKTDEWIGDHKPDLILLAAAKVGGIDANSQYPADFIRENLAIAENVIHSSFKYNIPKLVYLGSSCIYPRDAEQPIKEEALLTGPLEPTNEAYAIAKIAGIKLCQFYRRQYGCDFISLMPCNLYGPGDRWNEEGAHVIPSLISRIHQAKTKGQPRVTIWGSGNPLREFLYVDDLASAILLAAQGYSHELHLNIGSGIEITIRALAELVKKTVGYNGDLDFDISKPDGTPRKILDSSKMRGLSWKAEMSLEKGLSLAYEDFLISAPHVYKAA